jgi:hypothetical protein
MTSLSERLDSTEAVDGFGVYSIWPGNGAPAGSENWT